MNVPGVETLEEEQTTSELEITTSEEITASEEELTTSDELLSIDEELTTSDKVTVHQTKNSQHQMKYCP